MKNKLLIIAILLMPLNISNTYCMENFRLGIFGGVGADNREVSDYASSLLMGECLCGKYDGFSEAYRAGLLAEAKLLDFLNIEIRAFYLNEKNHFSRPGASYPSLVDDPTSPEGVSVVNTLSGHEIFLDFQTLSFNPNLNLKIHDNLYANAGLSASTFIYSQRRQLYKLIGDTKVQFKRPDNWEELGLKYEDNDRTIVISDKSIDEELSEVYFALNFGLHYDFYIVWGFYITLEISYNYGLNSAFKEYNFNMNSYQASLAIKYEFD